MNSFYKTIFSKDSQPLADTFTPDDGQETGVQPAPRPRQPSDVPVRPVRIQQPSFPIGQTISEMEIYSYPQNLRDALELIEAALNRETEDRNTYDFILKNAPPEDLGILKQFDNDEQNHYKVLRRIYADLTGQEAPPPSPLSKAVKKRSSYCEALEIGIMEIGQELQEYVRILYALQNRTHINMMLGIMINEIRHISTVNYLYAKSCRK